MAANDTYTATKNTVLTVTATTGVLANDTDADGDTADRGHRRPAQPTGP